MSDGSYTSSKVLIEPLRHIGAQDLLRIAQSHAGLIRKRGHLGRILGNSLKTKWKIKFVVISQGCVYCFNSGESKSPQSAFSLCVYDSVRIYASNYVKNCLEIVHKDPGKPSHVFGCETEDSLNEWIHALKDELELAHMDSPDCSAGSVDSGISGMRSPPRKGALPPLPEVPKTAKEPRYKPTTSEYELEEEEDDGDAYDEVVIMETVKPSDKTAQRQPIALPIAKPKITAQKPSLGPTSGATGGATAGAMSGNAPGQARRLPAGAVSIMPGSSIPGPPVKTKPMDQRRQSNTSYTPVMMPPPGQAPTVPPDYINEQMFPRETYFFDSSDRMAAERWLENTPEGTFLVRKSRSGGEDVLCVHTPHGFKEFKLTRKDGKLTLNNSTTFPSLDNMLIFHSQNPLPKNEYTIKLKAGYRA